MSDHVLTTREVADLFRCNPKKVSALATHLKVGMNLGGSAGYRFTEADVEAMRDHLRLASTS